MAAIPIDLEHYKKKRPYYLPEMPDRDLIAAVIVKTALRRKQWPDAFGTHVAWCNDEDEALGACLDKISADEHWTRLDDARVHDGEKPFPPLQAIAPIVAGLTDRSLGYETLLTFGRSLPRLRSIGEMVLAERAAEEALKNDPAPIVKKKEDDGGESGGGKKAKPSTPPAAADDEFFDDSILLTEEEAEELGIDLTPRWP